MALAGRSLVGEGLCRPCETAISGAVAPRERDSSTVDGRESHSIQTKDWVGHALVGIVGLG